jgi:hypothetical protein
MSAPMLFTKFEVRSHNSPDEVRTADKTRIEIVRLPGFTFGLFQFEPGWRWSECVKPVVKTDTCRLAHAGYVISGRLTVRMNDGTQKTIGPGDSYTIPSGHEAWVEGGERLVAIEVMSADQYAKR